MFFANLWNVVICAKIRFFCEITGRIFGCVEKRILGCAVASTSSASAEGKICGLGRILAKKNCGKGRIFAKKICGFVNFS